MRNKRLSNVGSPSRFFNRLSTSFRKRVGLAHSLSELDRHLSDQELVVRVPELDDELLEAIRLIAPQFRLEADEPSRRFWELNQNGISWAEFEGLEPVLEGMERPTKVLDIGPGMGRSTVFFKKKMGWQDVPFHLYEGSGEDTRYTRAGPRVDDSFCGSLDHLQDMLAFNEIENYQIFDADKLDRRLDRLPGPYDFIYSFYAVGFHWSLEHFLPEILGLMHENSVAAFTLHNRFDQFERIQGAPYHVVSIRSSWPRGGWWDLMVMSKNRELLEPIAAASHQNG